MTLDQVAQRYGVPTSRVKAWIRSGELTAVNVSRTAGSKRPRFVVTATQPADFEKVRSKRAVVPAKKRRRDEVPEYI